MSEPRRRNRRYAAIRLSLVELAAFALFAALMFLLRYSLQVIPSIHPLAMLMASFTLVWRVRALIPIYLYVAIEMIIGGFAFMGWLYLYAWFPLWAAILFWGFMFDRRPDMKQRNKALLLMLTCAAHGMLFGTLSAPLHVLMFGPRSWQAFVAYIAAGLWFDAVHAVGNFAIASLILPMVALLEKLRRRSVA